MITRNDVAIELERTSTNTVFCNALSDAYIAGDFDLVSPGGASYAHHDSYYFA
jgi:hypothetical protein